MRFHCLFEQSGTFKNVFKSYGHEAYDYDILNDYRQTDFQIDLFQEIMNEYDNICGVGGQKQTIFTNMKPETDFIMAFFPCTYFTDLNELQFKGYRGGFKAEINKELIEKIFKRDRERSNYFQIFIKFCFICQELMIRTIIENPVGQCKRNYLIMFSPWRPGYTENDRSLYGDKYYKPTLFFPINFEMKENFIMYDKEIKPKSVNKLWGKNKTKERSEITPRYADNFYKRFIEHQINSKF